MKDSMRPSGHPVSSELGQAMLRAAATEQPDRAAVDRTLAAIGAGLRTTASVAAPAGMSAVVKWGIGIGVCAMLVAGGVALRHSRSGSATPPPAITPAAVTAPPLDTVATDPPATPEVRSAGVASSVAAAPPPAPASTSAKPSATSLTDEVAAIDAARATLDRGDAKGCLAKLDAYQHAFPRGSLWQEATVMRIEALLRAGDRRGARALADRFFARNPSSPYSARIRSLLGDSNP
jgi:hypothetical protein